MTLSPSLCRISARTPSQPHPSPRSSMRRSLALTSLALSAGLALLALPAPLAAQAGSPAGPVPVANLKARRQALMDRMGSGIAILRSSTERSIEADGDHPQDSDYREDNDFFYLTGIEE